MVSPSTTVSAFETSSVVCGVPDAVTTTLECTCSTPSEIVTWAMAPLFNPSLFTSTDWGAEASKPGASLTRKYCPGATPVKRQAPFESVVRVRLSPSYLEISRTAASGIGLLCGSVTRAETSAAPARAAAAGRHRSERSRNLIISRPCFRIVFSDRAEAGDRQDDLIRG